MMMAIISSNGLRFLDNTCSGPGIKYDCGQSGTTEQQCVSNNCCWQPVDPNPSNLPWCFKPLTPPGPIPPYVPPKDGVPFNDEEVKTLMNYFLRNIDVSSMVSDPCSVSFGGPGFGGVVAAPDCNTGPGGSYVYAWMRDSALTMKALMQTNSDSNLIEEKLKKYALWILENHKSTSPHGIDIRTEPKFMLPKGGISFPGAWCRPQNDGPGLQAITMISYANLLMDSGKEDFVRQYLWTGDESNNNGGIIMHDLEYVGNNWTSNTCDLWEEIMSPDFFWNRYTMRKSLILGEAFARRMGDDKTADWYKNTAAQVTDKLREHWNGQFVYETQNRQKDAAVILAFNEGSLDDDFFPCSGQNAAATIIEFSKLFLNAYSINQQDDQAGVPGILYGRYEGDNYDGGGPWILLTAALSQLYYNSGIDSLKRLSELPEENAMNHWEEIIGSRPKTKLEFAKAMFSLGDGVLLRIRYHVEKSEFHLSEQLDRNTGEQLSAKDLTWSYAEVLKAMGKRKNLEELMIKEETK